MGISMKFKGSMEEFEALEDRRLNLYADYEKEYSELFQESFEGLVFGKNNRSIVFGGYEHNDDDGVLSKDQHVLVEVSEWNSKVLPTLKRAFGGIVGEDRDNIRLNVHK